MADTCYNLILMLNIHRKSLFLIFAILCLLTIGYLFFAPAYSTSALSIENLSNDEYFMASAMAEIGKNFEFEGFPIGAVIERDGKIIGRSSNKLFTRNNPTSHAEYIAIDKAINNIKASYPNEKYPDFFKNATLYTTLEPCPMCSGKATMLRFKRIVICDTDEEWGYFTKQNNLNNFPENPIIEYSNLDICKDIRNQDGWNVEDLWQQGKGYAAGINQVPSKLDFVIRKTLYYFNRVF